jgi:hypothetical protein
MWLLVSKVPTWVGTPDVTLGLARARVESPNIRWKSRRQVLGPLCPRVCANSSGVCQQCWHVGSPDVRRMFWRRCFTQTSTFSWTMFSVNVESPEICVRTLTYIWAVNFPFSINNSLPLSNRHPLIHCDQPSAKTTLKHLRLPSSLPFAPNFDSLKE